MSAKESYTVTIFRDELTHVATLEEWKKEDIFHREDGPAKIERDARTGIIISEVWLRNGRIERSDAPAVIRRDGVTVRVTYSAWYKDDQKVTAPARSRKFVKKGPAPA